MTAPRYRCTSCGNLTRFDVTVTRRTRAFHHYTVGGELTVEDDQVLDERVEQVECRWCGPAGRVEALSAGSGSSDGSAADPHGPSEAMSTEEPA